MSQHAVDAVRPIVWSIAGSDPGGGAGIQADLLTMSDLGCHGCTIITAVTAQNSVAVTAVDPCSSDTLLAQWDALASDLPPQAIKIGLLSTPEQVNALVGRLASLKAHHDSPVIYDPVAVASSGHAMAAPATLLALRELFPLVDLVTPNSHELALLTGTEPDSPAQLVAAAEQLRALGAKAVLVKGGHLAWSQDLCLDYFTNGSLSFWLAAPRLNTSHGHGTGCTLSSAIAAGLAQHYVMEDAITLARGYLQQGLAAARGVGAGPGPIAHLGWPSAEQHFPRVVLPGSVEAKRLGLCWAGGSGEGLQAEASFAPCPQQLGLYPVVDSVEWLKRLLDWGVRTLQLRIKDPAHPQLEAQIAQAVALGRAYEARLFINDYWQLAIRHGAYGVHLGQEDLERADLAAIQQAGLRLGISTHGYYEIARAMAIRPSYIALGHIFPTRTKQMPSAPQGLSRLHGYVNLLRAWPTVAIGGISSDRVASVLASGVGSVALVTAITEAAEPERVTRALLQQLALAFSEGDPMPGRALHG
jgi:hydroxymethylpyrimidine kinase / phosphomethylpyrimidine kinase / thiamine-phosphate diphosphorylase